MRAVIGSDWSSVECYNPVVSNRRDATTVGAEAKFLVLMGYMSKPH